MVTLGSLFDGIGGFPLAAVMNSILPVWASEIEPFPIEVTKKHFSEMIHVGDITQLIGAELPPVDIVTGGSPCQDLSVAGARAGLAGERSGLFMEQVRVVKEMRDADGRRGRTADAVRPRYMVWENVPGAFSSEDSEDFRSVLEEIVRIKDSSCYVPRPDTGAWESAGGVVLGDQFSLAWRVLDAQYWGVPQRRKRIFLIADFGGTSAGEILFKQDSLLGNSPESGSPREGATDAAEGCFAHPGGSSALPLAFAANQRDEVRDLHNIAGSLGAQPGMKQQTFVANCLTPWDTQQERIFTLDSTAPTLAGADGGGGRNPAGLIFAAGFSAGQGEKAGGIGYQEERAPTLKASDSGSNMVPSVLCLNDQGGSVMDISHGVSGTLRANERGHQPLVVTTQQDSTEIDQGTSHTITSTEDISGSNEPMLFENHGIDSRYTGPHDVAPTMSARYGAGGNNVPLVTTEPDSFCIAGNIIDREVHNGGNGFGYQPNISYTLNTADRHAVFSRQRSDVFRANEVVSTQTVHQSKDMTDLVAIPIITAPTKLIRRLTPLECERLQGFPDYWTDIPGASDSARYKALGNSVAIPCVKFVLRGIAFVLRNMYQED